MRPRRARGTANGLHAVLAFAMRSVANPTGPPRGPVEPLGARRYSCYPHLSTAIHKEKKKQKEKGPAYDGFGNIFR